MNTDEAISLARFLALTSIVSVVTVNLIALLNPPTVVYPLAMVAIGTSAAAVQRKWGKPF